MNVRELSRGKGVFLNRALPNDSVCIVGSESGWESSGFG